MSVYAYPSKTLLIYFNLENSIMVLTTKNHLFKKLLLTSFSGTSGRVKVDVSGTGRAVAIWRQYDGSQYNLNANHFK